MEQAGGRALAVKCDVSLEEEVNAALDKTDEAFGRRHGEQIEAVSSIKVTRSS